MLKIAIIFFSSLYLFASERPTEESDEYFPLRRVPAMSIGLGQYYLEQGNLEEKLLIRVVGGFFDDIDVSENSTIELIRSNPGNSNPYYGHYNAYLITLACRNGMGDIVRAIVESNPDSLNCLSAHHTPLDEAIAFHQHEVVKYLRSIGAKHTLVDTETH